MASHAGARGRAMFSALGGRVHTMDAVILMGRFGIINHAAFSALGDAAHTVGGIIQAGFYEFWAVGAFGHSKLIVHEFRLEPILLCGVFRADIDFGPSKAFNTSELGEPNSRPTTKTA